VENAIAGRTGSWHRAVAVVLIVLIVAVGTGLLIGRLHDGEVLWALFQVAFDAALVLGLARWAWGARPRLDSALAVASLAWLGLGAVLLLTRLL
jgi:hypothetical protein